MRKRYVERRGSLPGGGHAGCACRQSHVTCGLAVFPLKTHAGTVRTLIPTRTGVHAHMRACTRMHMRAHARSTGKAWPGWAGVSCHHGKSNRSGPAPALPSPARLIACTAGSSAQADSLLTRCIRHLLAAAGEAGSGSSNSGPSGGPLVPHPGCTDSDIAMNVGNLGAGDGGSAQGCGACGQGAPCRRRSGWGAWVRVGVGVGWDGSLSPHTHTRRLLSPAVCFTCSQTHIHTPVSGVALPPVPASWHVGIGTARSSSPHFAHDDAGRRMLRGLSARAHAQRALARCLRGSHAAAALDLQAARTAAAAGAGAAETSARGGCGAGGPLAAAAAGPLAEDAGVAEDGVGAVRDRGGSPEGGGGELDALLEVVGTMLLASRGVHA